MLLFFVLSACQPRQEELMIPDDTLIQVLSDAHIVEGALLSVKPSEKDSLRTLYYQQIFEIHEISEEGFEHDVEVLKIRPKLMEKIYGKVLETLKNKQSE